MNLKLRQYREAEGLTQKQFAKAIKKSTGTIQSWERGDSYPNAEAIWDMCIHFDTDPNTFLGWYDEHPREETPGLTSEEGEIVSCYRAAAPQWRTNIAMTARAAAGESKKAAEPSVREAGDMSEAV